MTKYDAVDTVLELRARLAAVERERDVLKDGATFAVGLANSALGESTAHQINLKLAIQERDEARAELAALTSDDVVRIAEMARYQAYYGPPESEGGVRSMLAALTAARDAVGGGE